MLTSANRGSRAPVSHVVRGDDQADRARPEAIGRPHGCAAVALYPYPPTADSLRTPLDATGFFRLATAPPPDRRYECQHPLSTGEEAYDLYRVSPQTACSLVRRLARYKRSLEHSGQLKRLYVCRGHQPELRQRRFAGWGISIRHGHVFTFSRGRSHFAVTGTDFPVPCS